MAEVLKDQLQLASYVGLTSAVEALEHGDAETALATVRECRTLLGSWLKHHARTYPEITIFLQVDLAVRALERGDVSRALDWLRGCVRLLDACLQVTVDRLMRTKP